MAVPTESMDTEQEDLENLPILSASVDPNGFLKIDWQKVERVRASLSYGTAENVLAAFQGIDWDTFELLNLGENAIINLLAAVERVDWSEYAITQKIGEKAAVGLLTAVEKLYWNPVHLAAATNKVSTLKTLLDAKGDIDILTLPKGFKRISYNALELAVDHNAEGTTELLLRHIANLPISRMGYLILPPEFLFERSRNRLNNSIMEMLIEHGLVLECKNFLSDFFYLAAYTGRHPFGLTGLYQNNFKNALHYFCGFDLYEKRVSIQIHLLCDAGLDSRTPDYTFCDGHRTPLGHLCGNLIRESLKAKEDNEIAKVLLAHPRFLPILKALASYFIPTFGRYVEKHSQTELLACIENLGKRESLKSSIAYYSKAAAAVLWEQFSSTIKESLSRDHTSAESVWFYGKDPMEIPLMNTGLWANQEEMIEYVQQLFAGSIYNLLQLFIFGRIARNEQMLEQKPNAERQLLMHKEEPRQLKHPSGIIRSENKVPNYSSEQVNGAITLIEANLQKSVLLIAYASHQSMHPSLDDMALGNLACASSSASVVTSSCSSSST